MLDLPAYPVLDKQTIVGKCLRLPLRIDEHALRSEIEALPMEAWNSTGGRVGVHRVAQAIFLRGYAPAEGDKPIEERPVLNALPYTRKLIEQIIPGQAQRCLLARLGPGAVITAHIDQALYFAKTVRIHVPVVTNDQVWMICQNEVFQMRLGEIWALNNSNLHAARNDHPSASRIHLICDFLPSAQLLELLARAERFPGRSLEAEHERAMPTH
jgi:hypothetical protein